MGITSEKLSELLNEEKWTRAAINSYSISNFEELDSYLEGASKEDLGELKSLCDEHLVHTKNSIIALYISGIISLKKRLIDDTHLIQLITLFSDNRKWKIVEYLSLQVLEYGENMVVLRLLADCYISMGEEEKKYEIWERLVKVDYEETDIVRQLAEYYEKQGDDEKSVQFFKKALYRYISYRNFNQIKDIWDNLLKKIPHEYEFFMQIFSKVASALSNDRANQLLFELYLIYKSDENWDKAIELIKLYLHGDPRSVDARTELISCYREKYKDHSKLEDYINESNLLQSYRNVEEAISYFEKHISLDAGNFVFHKSWGIGRISTIRGEQVTIDFTKKRGHSMSLKMAVNALTVLDKSHIWVLKSVIPREKLREKVKQDIPWALRTVIKSFGNSISFRIIKKELVPSVLTKSEWTAWNNEAKRIVKTDPLFGTNPEQSDEFVVRETPISYEEKMLHFFKSEKHFYQRVKIIKEFLANSDPDSAYFEEMFNYFHTIASSYASINDHVVSSYLLIKRFSRQYRFLRKTQEMQFNQVFHTQNEMISIFQQIEDSDLRKDFLSEIKHDYSDWRDHFAVLFPHFLTMHIIDELDTKDGKPYIKTIFQNAYDSYKDRPEVFTWLVKSYALPIWVERGIPGEKVLLALLHLLDITFRNISNKKDVTSSRKLNRTILGILFDEGVLAKYVHEHEADSVNRIYSLMKDIEDVDPSKKIELKHLIKERFPDFKFIGEDEKAETISGGLIVTEKSYYAKQEELRRILEVEIPENSREIGAARELGDLRENAEYKAGKERQEMLNITANKIKTEIDRAVIFDPSQLDESKVSFGTKVDLFNKKNNTTETYTILGPWESDPAKQVISYLSPFGAKLLNHTIGEEFSFMINDNEYDYVVNDIRKADF